MSEQSPGAVPPAPRWQSSRRWLYLAGVVVPALFVGAMALLAGLLTRDAVFGLAWFAVMVLAWVLPRAVHWRLSIVGTVLEHDDGVLSVLDRRDEVQATVDLTAVERLEAFRGDLLPNPWGRHTFSTVRAVWRDADAEPAEVVRTYVPFPDDFDAMLAFLRAAAEGTGAQVVDVTHADRSAQDALAEQVAEQVVEPRAVDVRR